MLADRTLEDREHPLYDPGMNRKQRARVLKNRQHHTQIQDDKRKSGQKEPPKIKRKQARKPKPE